jgi:uncharacterized protein (TIGR03437 family)
VWSQPIISVVANAFSSQQTFSPGSLVAVFGQNLIASGSATTVLVGGQAAYVSPSQSSATKLIVELPVNLPTGFNTLVANAGGQLAEFGLQVSSYAPAIEASDLIGTFYDSNSNQITLTNPATPGAIVTGYATGLGATNPPVATGVAPGALAPTSATVTVSIGGEVETAAFAGEASGNPPGVYVVSFAIPKDATGCGDSVILGVGGASSPPVAIPIATPQPTICGVENAASGAVRDATHPTSANTFLAFYVASLGVATAPNLFPAANFQGVEVSFNGTPLPLYNIDPVPPTLTLVNTALPADAATSGTGTITISNSNGTSQAYTIALAPNDPGVFELPIGVAPPYGVILLANTYWFAIPVLDTTGLNLPICVNLPASTPCGAPAHPGDNIVIYLTGAGLATPGGDPNSAPLALGQIAPLDGSVLYQTVAQPIVRIGGLAAPVTFSGISPGTAAEYQINTTVPLSVVPSNKVEVLISFGAMVTTTAMAVVAQ